MSEHENKDIVIRIGSKNIIEILIGMALGIVVMVLIYTQGINIYNSTGKENIISTDESIATYAINSTKIGAETEEFECIKEDIRRLVDDIRNKPSYVQVQLGEEFYMYYLYNTSHEIFIQDNEYKNTEVILESGRALKYNSDNASLIDGYDMDIASIIENSFNAVGTDGVQLFDMDLGNELDEDTHEYRIDFVGEEAAKQLYSSLNDEFATDMIDGIKQSIEEETEGDWEPHIILVIRLNSKDLTKSYGRMLYVKDNEEYINWILQGYTHINDWKLNNEWYEYDPSTDESGEKYTELINDTMDTVVNTLNTFVKDQGWDLEEELSNSNDETNEVTSNIKEDTD